MLRPGQRLGVATSGGADSVCLLDALCRLASSERWRLTVVHVNHGLRGEESNADERFVGEIARVRDLEFRTICADLVTAGGNLEEAAREVRLQYFRSLIGDGVVDRVATGHTRSDQAETVLFRFLRGSGTAGLAAILPVTREGLVRPLIEVTRADVIDYLRQNELTWREDSSNQDDGFARNRIRHHLLPQLAAEWNPSIEETLARTAAWARDEEEDWRARVEPLMGEARQLFDGAIVVPVESLAGVSPALARRYIRSIFARVKGDLRAITLAHVDRVLEMTQTSDGNDRAQAPGLDVMRSFEWIRVGRPAPPAPRDFLFSANPPCRIELPGGYCLSFDLAESGSTPESVYNSDVGRLDWHRLACPLEVRNYRPGDRYQPVGTPGETKIKTMFQDARVPLWERRTWPVLAAGGVIVWSRGFGPASPVAASPGSGEQLIIREEAMNSVANPAGAAEVEQ